jgi:hypothetical protein
MALRPISEAPKDGTELLLRCQGETPEWVSCKYVTIGSPYDWQGWAYADIMLADVCPSGPDNPTHFIEIPETSETSQVEAGPSNGEILIKSDVYKFIKNMSPHQVETLQDYDFNYSIKPQFWSTKTDVYPIVQVTVVARSGRYMDIKLA